MNTNFHDEYKLPHGEPYAGKLHVRFDEGAGVPDEGRPAQLYTLGVLCPYIERMQESVRAAYRSYAAAYGYEL